MGERDVEICFVFFRSTNLVHLDAAWYSLSRQDFSRVKRVWFLDNATPEPREDVRAVLDRYPIPVPLNVSHDKHNNPWLTHSWSANRTCKAAEGPILFFARSDYALAFDCLASMLAEFDAMTGQGLRPFVSGWCWQMAYDRNAQNIDAPVDIEQYHWREGGMDALLQHPYAFRFHETDLDAGVWLTRREYMHAARWYNEKLTSWGYQQSAFQRALTGLAGVSCRAIQRYLFAHLHHYSVRDFRQASAEYQQYGQNI